MLASLPSLPLAQCLSSYLPSINLCFFFYYTCSHNERCIEKNNNNNNKNSYMVQRKQRKVRSSEDELNPIESLSYTIALKSPQALT